MNKIQYTIRSVPPQLDRVLRKRAKQAGKSFNQTIIETLNRQVFGKEQAPKTQDNFDWLYGAAKLDKEFYEAIEAQSQIDEDLWR